jgi:hypothetical protein
MMLRGVAVLALLAAGLSPAPASAKGVDTEACSENVPPVSAQYVRYKNSPEIYGAVQLRRDTCYQYWGYVQLYKPVPSSRTRANAFLVYWEEGTRQYILSCEDPGGNGYVTTGQTTCRTPKKSRALVDGFMASAYGQVLPDGGAWSTFATGQTAIMPGGT